VQKHILRHREDHEEIMQRFSDKNRLEELDEHLTKSVQILKVLGKTTLNNLPKKIPLIEEDECFIPEINAFDRNNYSVSKDPILVTQKITVTDNRTKENFEEICPSSGIYGQMLA